MTAEYVSGRPIYEPFMGTDKVEGYGRLLRWWYQEYGPTQGEKEGGRKIK